MEVQADQGTMYAFAGRVKNPDYNGHLVRDVGLVYFVSGVGFVWCAFNLRRCWPAIVAQAMWTTGHAVLHVADMLAARLPHTHWILDMPGVLLAGAVLGVLAAPGVWRKVNPLARETLSA